MQNRVMSACTQGYKNACSLGPPASYQAGDGRMASFLQTLRAICPQAPEDAACSPGGRERGPPLRNGEHAMPPVESTGGHTRPDKGGMHFFKY